MAYFGALIRLCVGLAVGSFLNVIAVRYDPDKFILSNGVVNGRSHCPKCGTTLRWFELVPLVSFLIQMGKCRTCGARLSFQYPVSELLSALIFLFVPAFAARMFFMYPHLSLSSVSILWTFAFELLLLLSLIDIRLNIIPDELNIILGACGVLIAWIGAGFFGSETGSFFGPYAALFGLQNNILANRAAGLLACSALFAFLILITKGRAMGVGDLKLAAALGLLFGWPDGFLLSGLAFVSGAVLGGLLMSFGRKTMKSFLPFGPFLAFAAVLVFFFGSTIAAAYFSLFPGGGGL